MSGYYILDSLFIFLSPSTCWIYHMTARYPMPLFSPSFLLLSLRVPIRVDNALMLLCYLFSFAAYSFPPPPTRFSPAKRQTSLLYT